MISKVAAQLVNWEEIHVYFGISLEQADEIRTNCPTYLEQKQRMLFLWKKFNDHEQNATINNFKKIFWDVRNIEMVEYIDEITAVTSTNTPAIQQDHACQRESTYFY